MKSTRTYCNPLSPENETSWEVIEGSEGNLTQLTIAEDPESGDYTIIADGDVVILEISYPSQALKNHEKNSDYYGC